MRFGYSGARFFGFFALQSAVCGFPCYHGVFGCKVKNQIVFNLNLVFKAVREGYKCLYL